MKRGTIFFIIIGAIIALAAASAGVWWAISSGVFSGEDQELVSANGNTDVAQEMDEPTNTGTEEEAAEDAEDDTAAIKDQAYYVSLAERKGVTNALEQLEKDMMLDDALVTVCGDITYQIGLEEGRSEERAVGFASEAKKLGALCGSRYISGYIFGMVQSSSDTVATALDVCGPLADNENLKAQCYRGFGEALYFKIAQNSVDPSLAICDQLEDASAQYNCSNGVFRSYFTPSASRGEVPTLFGICDGVQNEGYKTNCYLQIPRAYLGAHQGAYVDALAWCEGAGESYRLVCASGVGTVAVMNTIADPLKAQVACVAAEEAVQASCISGLTVGLMDFYGDAAPLKQICDEMKPENRAACDALNIETDDR